MRKKRGFCQEAYQSVPYVPLVLRRAGLEDTAVIRTRRVSIRVQHTEISATVSQVFVSDDRSASAHAPGDCPDCGSPASSLLLDAVDALDIAAPLLKSAADEGRLHLFCSPDNQVWICDRSLQHMKEKF